MIREAGPQGNGIAGYSAGVGWYTDRILPRLVDVTCGSATMAPLRRRACAGLSGRVVELGFGSGINLEYLPPGVTTLVAVEPSDRAWEIAAGRITGQAITVERVSSGAEELPLEDASADAALSTFTLCTIPDLARALAELRRVLRPGCALHFAEHGDAPDDSVRRWQRRFEPVQRRVAGGCHLTRDIPAELEAAGFDVRVDERRYLGRPRSFTSVWVGTAVAAA